MAADIEAGKAHIKTYVENSDLVKGLRVAEGGLKDFGSRIAAIGSKMTGVGDVIGLTVGKDFAATMLKAIGGATLGAAIAAPLGLAFSKIFQSGQANGLIVELVKLGDSLSAIFDDLATALVPPLTAAARVVTGIVSATATWLRNNRQLVMTVAQFGGTIASIGATLAVLGQTTSFIGQGFGLVAKILPLIAGFLASPLGLTVLIAAAIGAAVLAWLRFTESGKAAAKFLLDFFAPAIAFIKQLVGGIGDALMAGDLALAGQIAMKGLQIVFVTGLNFLSDLIGGTLGEAIGEIGAQIAGGDFTGAWQTAVAGMAKLWADFSNGVVTVFSAAAKAVVDKWQGAVNSIAGGLLKASAKGGVMGKIASLIVGADVKKLQEENDRLDRQRKSGAPQSIFEIGNQAIAQHTGGIADQIKGFLDSVQQQAQNNADQADQNLKDRLNRQGGIHRGDEGKLQNELDALNKRAAQERAGIQIPQLPGKQEFGQVAVGFSGAALAAQLQGGSSGPQKQLLDEAKKQRDLLARAVTALDVIKEKIKPFAFGA